MKLSFRAQRSRGIWQRTVIFTKSVRSSLPHRDETTIEKIGKRPKWHIMAYKKIDGR